MGIIGHGRGPAAALSMFDRMQAEGFKPNENTYGTMIRVFEQRGQWQGAVEMLHAMKAVGITTNTSTYNAIISACEKVNLIEP